MMRFDIAGLPRQDTNWKMRVEKTGKTRRIHWMNNIQKLPEVECLRKIAGRDSLLIQFVNRLRANGAKKKPRHCRGFE